MQNLLEELKKLLEQDERLVVEGKLLKNKIIESALKLDVDLIRLLLKSEPIRKHFFQEVDGVLVFDKIKFQKFVSNKAFLPDSYTSFKNKIGLVTEREEYLSESKEVILAWPYKDCILEGGQEKEDDRRKEIFHNEILAPDEIDRLLEPKVLTNFKRIDINGEHKVTEIKENDNLIIRGNNLLALHSLQKRFSGKVKLIYIDPPYNTGNDSFKYNDNFNHSTWLTFMKNRLKIASDLLRDDGVIFVQCDDNENAYLKILMDEVLGRENFVSNIVYKRRQSQANLSKNISPIHDLIIVFSKSKNINLNRISTDINESTYSNPDNDPRGFYVTMPCTNKGGAKYKITTPTGKIIEDEWRFKRETYFKLEKENKLVFPNSGNGKPRYKLFLNDKRVQGNIPNTWWDNISSNQEANREIKEIFGEIIFSFPKPEALIQRIIEISTNKNDIILDYHLGSGTTCAVAHKMGKQYIGIEQMDYIETIAVKRLKKVIDGEQGGISKSVNWQGGGDFIYCELIRLNERYIDEIEKATTISQLLDIWKIMKEKAFLSYKVDVKQFDENVNEFEELDLENQKKFLIECLDKNQLYINLSEIDDAEYEISEEDKELNKQFYEVK